MKQHFYKVRYLWRPASAGFQVPADQLAFGSTIEKGTSARSVEQKFQTTHPHVQVVSVKRDRCLSP